MDKQHEILKFKYELLCQCYEKAASLKEKALTFAECKGWEQYDPIEEYRKVVVTGARYLHRGYYCPSLIRHLVIDNSRRGKILVRPTERSKISHKYYFDGKDRLAMIKATIPNRGEKTEYLQYEGNRVYGFAFDDWGTLVGLSEEQYEDGVLSKYLVVSCYISPEKNSGVDVAEMYYESYCDIAKGEMTARSYYIYPPLGMADDKNALDLIVRGQNYICTYEGKKSYGLVNVKLKETKIEDDSRTGDG